STRASAISPSTDAREPASPSTGTTWSNRGRLGGRPCGSNPQRGSGDLADGEGAPGVIAVAEGPAGGEAGVGEGPLQQAARVDPCGFRDDRDAAGEAAGRSGGLHVRVHDDV